MFAVITGSIVKESENDKESKAVAQSTDVEQSDANLEAPGIERKAAPCSLTNTPVYRKVVVRLQPPNPLIVPTDSSAVDQEASIAEPDNHPGEPALQAETVKNAALEVTETLAAFEGVEPPKLKTDS